jgi:hypothetical protein
MINKLKSQRPGPKGAVEPVKNRNVWVGDTDHSPPSCVTLQANGGEIKESRIDPFNITPLH